MMFAVYIGIGSIVLSLLLLWGLSLWSSRQGGQRSSDHTASTPSPQTTGRTRLWLVPGVILVLGLGVYLALFRQGPAMTPEAMPSIPPLSAEASSVPANTKGGDLNSVVKRLADKMEADPNNGDGWLLLAKTYKELRRFAEADATYAKAAALLPPDAGMLADWADVHVMARDRKWDDAGRDIVKKALAADPKHVKSLALAGSEAFDRADYKAAIALWKRMKAAAQPESMDSRLADENIAEAEAMMGGKKASAESAPAVVAGPVVGGTIKLSGKLSAKVEDGDTLFVVAKAPDGKGPPLAVWRRQGKDFPVAFVLDDNAAIMPGRTISQYSEVLLSAKVSKSGVAESANGDLLAPPTKVRVGSTAVTLELSELVSGK